jgi:pimeloyl-ACP methyl ester carboxylesterase
MKTKRQQENGASNPPKTKSKDTCKRLLALFICTTILFSSLSVFLLASDEEAVGSFRTPEGRSAYKAAYDEAMSLLPEPTQTHDVETTFGIVRVYEWSNARDADKAPVVLLPGHSSGTPMWYANLADFASGRTVYAFDPLGDAGMSVNIVPLRDAKDQAQYIDEALEKLGVEKAHFVGHSFGGATAAAVALYRPQRMASLSLLDPVFTLSAPSASVLLWATLASIPFLPEAWRNQAMLNMIGEEASDTDFDDPVAGMIAEASGNYADALPTPKVLTDEELMGIDLPVYVALAEKSLSGKSAAERAALMPHALTEVWAETTHSLPMEVSREMDTRLETFWASADGGQ